MDEMVLSTQKWLNKKYSNVTGFDKVQKMGEQGGLQSMDLLKDYK
ncbi:hypothetical protein [Enterococcus faecium]|nr:hypothetical protein [Enterococcus faecium]